MSDDEVFETPTQTTPITPPEKSDSSEPTEDELLTAMRAIKASRKEEREKEAEAEAEAKALRAYNMPDYCGLNECDNADRFVRYCTGHNDCARYVPEQDTWYCWNGIQYKPDPQLAIMMGFAEKVGRAIVGEGMAYGDEDLEAAYQKWADRTCSYFGLNAMIKLARPRLSTAVEEWDKHPFLLNCRNGILHLGRKRLTRHAPQRRMSKLAYVNFDPEATCPNWDSFIATVLNHDAELIRYMQVLLGYCLTADTRIQKFHVLMGGGSNGKSTMINLMTELMGTYAKSFDTASIIKIRSSRAPREDLARLVGARLVAANEMGVGATLDDSLIKRLTGNDAIACRALYQNTFEYVPKFKLLMSVNTLPRVTALDHGMWRRAAVIPFEVKITADEADPDLPKKLRRERSGILNWLLEGVQWYLQNGWPECQKIKEATDNWQLEEDSIEEWIQKRCFLGPEAHMKLGELYEDFKINSNGKMGRLDFSAGLVRKGFRKKRENTGMVFHGICTKVYAIMNNWLSLDADPLPEKPKAESKPKDSKPKRDLDEPYFRTDPPAVNPPGVAAAQSVEPSPEVVNADDDQTFLEKMKEQAKSLTR